MVLMSDSELDGGDPVKDMASDYISKISEFLDDIDAIKQDLINDPKLVIRLRERLHNLFIYLTRKMSEREIKTYRRMQTELNKNTLFSVRKKLAADGQIIPVRQINPQAYPKYVYELEMIEIYLHKIMERVGLTLQTRKQNIRLA